MFQSIALGFGLLDVRVKNNQLRNNGNRSSVRLFLKGLLP
jgi:hypothetical protein